ncbi:MAG: hypothetical protein MK180_06050 [Rhodobacteraceae bacterium]|nr:hypothetical protein [Paracoccaceae bacterium]
MTDPLSIEARTQITQIDNQPGMQTVSYTDTFGHFKTLTANRTIVAMAPAVSASLQITNIDKNRMGLPNAMQNSNMIMTFVTFKSAFWRQDTTSYPSGRVSGIPTQNISRYGLLGDALLADEDVVWIMDNTSAEGLPALFAFKVGDAAVKWRQQTKAARETMVKGYMTKLFGSQVGTETIDYYEHD